LIHIVLYHIDLDLNTVQKRLLLKLQMIFSWLLIRVSCLFLFF